MEYEEISPPLSLATWIHRLWYLRGGEGCGPVQPVVPDGRAEIVLHLGEPFSLVDAAGAARRQAQVLAAGQLTRPQRLLPSADADVIGVRLTAAGAGALLGVPMHELTNEILPLADVNAQLAAVLLNAASRAGGTVDRLAAVASVVGRWEPREPALLVRSALRGLENGDGLATIARRVGVTSRTLQRRFATEVGVTPKTYARVARFRRAYRALTQSSPPPAAQVAALAGYCDQAHFIRDFGRFAGESPKRFFQHPTDLASAFLTTAIDGSAEPDAIVGR